MYGREGLLPIYVNEQAWLDLGYKEDCTTAELLEVRARQIEHSEENRQIARRRVDKAREQSAEDRQRTINIRPEDWQIYDNDLVLLRNTDLERQYGQKLRMYWKGPFRATRSKKQKQWKLYKLDGSLHKEVFDKSRLKLFRQPNLFEAVEIE